MDDELIGLTDKELSDIFRKIFIHACSVESESVFIMSAMSKEEKERVKEPIKKFLQVARNEIKNLKCKESENDE